jgi:hypothetical protein
MTGSIDVAYSKQYAWMEHTGRAVVVDDDVISLAREKHETPDADLTQRLAEQIGIDKNGSSSPRTRGSILFISTKFCAFNAQSFKRFAISIHLSLQRSLQMSVEEKSKKGNTVQPKLNVYLEVFHPEYIGSTKGYNHSLRRSPFPMILICYEVGKL